MPTASTNAHTPTSIRMNLCLDWDAAQLLYRYCPPGQKAMGRFLSRLIFEHVVREEERNRCVAPEDGRLTDDGQAQR
jgi:hypothetical protein